MTGRRSFSTLRNQMSPEAQDRARATSEVLEREMALAEVRCAMKLSQEELGGRAGAPPFPENLNRCMCSDVHMART